MTDIHNILNRHFVITETGIPEIDTGTPVDRQTAPTLSYRKKLWHRTRRNADGTPMRVRVNGACKTWKTRPAEFRLPIKHGLNSCGAIDETNCGEWVIPNHG